MKNISVLRSLSIVISVMIFLISGCKDGSSPPDETLTDHQEAENSGLVVYRFGKTFENNEEWAVGAWLAVNREDKNGVIKYIRLKPNAALMYADSNTIDIPVENAKALVEFIKWAKEKSISDEDVKSKNLIYHPLPGVNYWIRRSLPSDSWEDGSPNRRTSDDFIMEIDIEVYLENLEKAIADSSKI